METKASDHAIGTKQSLSGFLLLLVVFFGGGLAYCLFLLFSHIQWICVEGDNDVPLVLW